MFWQFYWTVNPTLTVAGHSPLINPLRRLALPVESMSMSLKGFRFGFFVFFALSAGVALNLLLLQPKPFAHPGVAQVRPTASSTYIETASLERRTYQRPKQPTQPNAVPIGTASKPVVLNHDTAAASDQDPADVGIRKRFLPVDTGNTAELVRALQRELKIKGYDPGAEDGTAGLVTRAAIFAYQYDNRLELTAAPSEKLLQTLVLGGSGEAQKTDRRSMTLSGDARDLVLATQRGLKQQGLWPSPVDGHFNTALSRAIQQFETAQRLPTTGRISGRFMARLVRLSGVGREATLR